MKKTGSLLVAVSLLMTCFACAASAEVCPYDSDYRYVLEKALADYYSNPQSSRMQPAEIKQMLDFYLSNPSITDADCSAGGIDVLISKADDQIPDDILGELDKRILPPCDSCSDGTKCSEQNDMGQTCACKDVNRDNVMEFCLLRPMKPTWPACEVCPDGTACGEDNQDDQLCACKDVNRDGKDEYCFLKISRPRPKPPFPWLSCNQCSDGTACGQKNSNGDKCRCYDKRRNGNYSHCYIDCDSCPDGTKCGEKNANGDLCGCRFGSRRWDDKYRECLLRCDKCSDGTDCWDRNSQGSLCTCGPRYSRRYYDKCSIWPPSNTTTTTGGTTTTSGPTTTTQVTTTTPGSTTTASGTTTTSPATSTSTTQETTTTSSGTTTTAGSTTTTTSSGTTTTASSTSTTTTWGQIYAGWRSSEYGYQQEQGPAYWISVANKMTAKVNGTRPGGVWVLGQLYGDDNRTCLLSFPITGSYPNIESSGQDINDAYLTAFDTAGLGVWLQVEPADANVSTLIDLVLNQYSRHSSVIGFGIDVEWLNSADNPDGRTVTDAEASSWLARVKSHNPNYKLFLKHWDTGKMPPSYRDSGLVFISDACIFNSETELLDDFNNWATTFSDSDVAFQIGYEEDQKWWSTLSDPPKQIGNDIVTSIPNTKGVYWVDFTITQVFPA